MGNKGNRGEEKKTREVPFWEEASLWPAALDCIPPAETYTEQVSISRHHPPLVVQQNDTNLFTNSVGGSFCLTLKLLPHAGNCKEPRGDIKPRNNEGLPQGTPCLHWGRKSYNLVGQE